MVVGGVPYISINNGMKINVGIDIINTLSMAYGVSVPLFVDNAESVTSLENCSGQVIRLVVSEHDISVRQIQRLTLDGVIEPVSNERPYRYQIETVCPQYCKFLEARAAAGTKRETIADIEEEKLRAESRIKKAKAEIAELQAQELSGKLHRAEDVEAITTDHVLFLRSMLMAMPGKLAVELAGNHTAAEQSERVRKEVYFILNQLANYRYDPDVYRQRVNNRQKRSDSAPAFPET